MKKLIHALSTTMKTFPPPRKIDLRLSRTASRIGRGTLRAFELVHGMMRYSSRGAPLRMFVARPTSRRRVCVRAATPRKPGPHRRATNSSYENAVNRARHIQRAPRHVNRETASRNGALSEVWCLRFTGHPGVLQVAIARCPMLHKKKVPRATWRHRLAMLG